MCGRPCSVSSHVFSFGVIVGLALVTAIIGKEVSVSNETEATIFIIVLFTVLFAVIPGLTMGSGWLIGRHGEWKRNKKHSL